ncbi:MAG: NADH-quinone oxidoreductase subunit C, partial [Chromatiales bacterium]|nr:NADH-quinone oxidoreductase subunit C [Chromatiales bacterium]
MSDTLTNQAEERLNSLAEALVETFADKGCEVIQRLSEVTLIAPKEQWLEIAQTLQSDERFAFAQVVDACGVDYSTYGQSEWVTTASSATGYGRGVERENPLDDGATRFAAVYHLLSVANNQRLRVRIFVDSEFPVIDSVVNVWSGANWFEREAFDLYGILFDGHPDLR